MIVRRCLVFAYLLVALAACGGGGGDQPSAVPPGSGAPGVPIRLVASTGSGRIELTWQGVANAGHYNIYYDDAPGVTTSNGLKIGNVHPPVTITGLTNGTTYYLIVTAENSVGEGQASPEIGATPELRIPQRVSRFRAASGDGTATLEWEQQLDTDSYNLYWWTDSRADTRQIADVSAPFTLSGLLNGTRHEFEIAGVNAIGEGQKSGPTHATPIDPATGWTPQTRISEYYFDPIGGLPSAGSRVSLANVAIHDSGVAAAAWTIGPGINATSVMVNHNVGGQWGVAQIMERDEDLGRPSVAVTSDGSVVVAYQKNAAAITTRTYRNGSWQDPVRIDSMGIQHMRIFPELASDAVGNVFAVWQELLVPQGSSTTVHQVWARRYDAATGAWGDAVMLVQSPRGVLNLIVEAAGDGRAIAGWIQDTQAYDDNLDGGGPPLRVAYASYFDGTDWSTATPVGRTNLVGDDEALVVAVDINDNGDAVALSTVRLRPSATTTNYALDATRLDAQSGTWSAPVTLRDSTLLITPPAVAIDATGIALAAWSTLSLSGTDYSLQATTGGVDGSWNALQEIESVNPAEVSVHRWPSGESILAWVDAEGIHVRRSPDGGGNWGSAELLGGHSGSMDVSISANGRVVVGANYETDSIDVAFGPGTENAIVVSTYTP